MDNNQTEYNLDINIRNIVEKLQELSGYFALIDSQVKDLSNNNINLSVDIKNQEIVNVFKKINKELTDTDTKAQKIVKGMNKALSDTAGLNNLTNAIKHLTNSFGALSKESAPWAKSLESTIKTSIAKGVRGGFSSSIRQDRSGVLRQATAASDKALKQISALETRAKQLKENVDRTMDRSANHIYNSVRDAKRYLNDEGIEVNSISDLTEFINAGAKARSGHNWSRKEVAELVGSVMGETYTGKMTEAVAAAFAEKMRAVEDKLSDYKKKKIESETAFYEKMREKAEFELNDKIERELEKTAQKEARRKLFYEGVHEAQQMLSENMASANSPEQKHLQDQYNRAVQRMRGVYDSAKAHGRYESRLTIYAAMSELASRTMKLSSYNLSEKMGIPKLKKDLDAVNQEFTDMGQRINKVSSVITNIAQGMGQIQGMSANIVNGILGSARGYLSQIFGTVKGLISQATEAYASLEQSMIGFTNFFGEQNANTLMNQIKAIAAEAPGLSTTELAEYVRQIAPVAGGNQNLALNAAMGMLKTIQYGGANGSTEMEYVIKNIRDVLSKGTATQIDIRQFNRAMPILEKVLGEIGESQLVKDGVLTIDKSNVDTILSAFAKLNTSELSEVSKIFDVMNKTLSGQWEQFTEQFQTNLMGMLKDSGVYGLATDIMSQFNEGMYAQTGLARLGGVIKDFVNNINWVSVQRYASYFVDAFKIIWEGVKSAFDEIKSTVDVADFRDMLRDAASVIADFVRGLGNTVTQVIKMVNRLLDSGIGNAVANLVTWLAALKLPQMILSFTANMQRATGNLAQYFANDYRTKTQDLIKKNTDLLKSIPDSIKAKSVNTNVSYDKDGNLMVLGKNPDGIMPGGGTIWTKDKKTGEWNQHGYSYYEMAGMDFSRKTGGKDSVVKQLMNGNSPLRQQLKKSVLNFERGLVGVVNGISTAIAGVGLSETVASVVESLDLFGESSTAVAGAVKAAGLAITGAISGAQIGGIAGGVVGALMGLGVGIVNLINTIKQKDAELKSSTALNKLDEFDRDYYNNIMSGINAYFPDLKNQKNSGNAIAFSKQQLSDYIYNTPKSNISGIEAMTAYLQSYVWKKSAYDFQDYLSSSAWQGLGGNKIDISADSDQVRTFANYLSQMAMLEGQGYYWNTQDKQYYKDKSFSPESAVSASEIVSKYLEANGGYLTDTMVAEAGKKLEELLTSNKASTTDRLKTMVDKTDDKELKEQAKALDEDVVDLTGETAKAAEGNEELTGLLSSGKKSFMDYLHDLDANTAEILKAVVEDVYEGDVAKLDPDVVSRLYGKNYGNAQELFGKNTNAQNSFSNKFGSGWGDQLSSLTSGNFLNKITGGWFDPGTFFGGVDYQRASLKAWAAQKNWGPDAVDDLTNEEVEKIYKFVLHPSPDAVTPSTIAKKITDELKKTTDEGKIKLLNEAFNDIGGFEFKDDNLLWWLRLLQKWQTRLGGSPFFFANGGPLAAPVYRSRGVDTVPAMLAPGEFVMKNSAVKKAGLGVMYSLNRGDIGSAARSLSSQVNNNWNKNSNYTTNYNRNNKSVVNNIKVFNKNSSARLNSYYGLANRLAI